MKRHPCMKSALMREDDGFFCRTPVRCVLVVGLKRRKLCPCRLYTHSKVSTVFHRIAMSSIVWLGSHPQERTVRSSKYVNQHTEFILCSHILTALHFISKIHTNIFLQTLACWESSTSKHQLVFRHDVLPLCDLRVLYPHLLPPTYPFHP